MRAIIASFFIVLVLVSSSFAYDMEWKFRAVTEADLDRAFKLDYDISPSRASRILAKLNSKDFDHIQEDIKNKVPMKVPNDFRAYKTWSPLPGYISSVSKYPQFIIVVKSYPYIGWYAYGKLVDSTYGSIGKPGNDTRVGSYYVLEKDVDHVSRSYRLSSGRPAPMPYALRIYGTVWLHAGDIRKGDQSHGCINLPIFSAIDLYKWAVVGTPVVVVNTLSEITR